MRNHPVFIFLVFTCFLVIGYTLSIRFYQPVESIFSVSLIKVTTENQIGIPTLNNGQRSILLVGANAITSTKPQLESIWLATYFPTSTAVQLLPIFPSGEKSITKLEQQLDDGFSLNKVSGRLGLDKSFLAVLEENNYWWSGYIVFDEASLEKAIKLLDGIQLNGKMVSDVTDLFIPGVMENPKEAYAAQIAILQSMCHKSSGIETEMDLMGLTASIPGHIITNLDASQLQMDLETLFANHRGLTCRFPTLEISRIEP